MGTTAIPVHGLWTVGLGMDLVIINQPRSAGIDRRLPLLIIHHLHTFLDRLEPARPIHMRRDHTVVIPHGSEILDSDGLDVRLEPRVGTPRGGDGEAVGTELGGVTANERAAAAAVTDRSAGAGGGHHSGRSSLPSVEKKADGRGAAT